jgi:hypothetical protein
MKWALVLTAAGLVCAPSDGFAQTPATKKTHKSSSPHTASQHVSTQHTSTQHTSTQHTAATGSAVHASVRSSSASAHTAKGKRTAKGRARAATPAIQNHPDPERYQQIQQALSDRGYFKGDANGAWGADSQDALLRFQTDKKLDADGKITALTLQNLGLGPTHDGSSMPLSSPKPHAPATAEIPALNAPTSGTPEVARPATAQGAAAQTPGRNQSLTPQQN